MYAPHAKQPRPGISQLFLLRCVLPAGLDALQNALTVLVQLQLRDDDFGRVNADGNRLPGRLLLDDSLDMDDILETVHGGDLPFPSLVGTPHNSDLVVFSDGDGADLVGCVRAHLEIVEGQDIRCTSHGAPCSMGRS